MKLPGMTDEERELKEWLTGLLPEGLSRQDVADELNVTRKTFANMISPNNGSFGHGLTMLRYLRLVGAVAEAPAASPASSRLAALEEEVRESVALTRRALELLQAQAERQGNAADRARPEGTGTDG